MMSSPWTPRVAGARRAACAALALAGALAFSAGAAGVLGSSPPARQERSKVQVEALIDQEGTTLPAWWDAVPLEFPSTLDLTWARPPPGSPWDTQKNVGQYLWSVINENPGRWQRGAKFMYHVAEVNQDRTEARTNAWNALGHIYADLLQDYARGAYFWRRGGGGNVVGLADCYWRLGCKPMAVEEMNAVTFDGDRYGAAIRLWADMGEPTRALELAELSARAGNAAGAYLSAGNVCRLLGRYDEAIGFYQQVLAVPAQGKRDWRFQKDLAQAAIEAIRVFEVLDLKQVRDGTYAGTSLSFAGELSVSVTMTGGRITDVRVTQHHDKQFYAAMTETPALIIEKQSLRDIDATTGATVTSDAIVNATAKALAGARQPSQNPPKHVP